MEDNFFLNAYSKSGWCDIVGKLPGKQDNPISFYAVPLTYFVKQCAQFLTGYQRFQEARTCKTPV